MADELQLRLVALDDLALWRGNAKKHDLDRLRKSIRRYGLKVVPRLEPSLNNGEGGVVAGNGRVMALRAMRDAGEAPPRGVTVDRDGRWMLPVLVGVDAGTESEAVSFGIDDNALIFAGSGLDFEDLVQLFDEEALQALLSDSPDAAELLVGIDSVDLDALLAGPQFDPVGAGDQPRLDEKKRITCPECGAEFRP